MTLEEQLDHLIELWGRSSLLRPMVSDEVETRLAAAETLRSLQAMAVPSAFAVQLEARVCARAEPDCAAEQGVHIPTHSSAE